ncbi:MAG TPA: response regulator [Burkholderiales bacterium]|nr:response regulator [Burkholderiales bacterium]
MQFWHPLVRQAQNGESGRAPGAGPSSGNAPARTPALDRSRRKILLVEDDLDAVHTLAYVLRRIGHQVEYAINGYAALELARKFRPDFMILDLGLPGMNGFELCQRIKADRELRATRIIALTAYGQEEYRKRSLAAGCELHLVKPHDPAVLAGYIAGSA